MNMKRRVVVTGVGVVSSVGVGKQDFWSNLVGGKSGISDIETFDTSEYPNHRGGEVKNFNPLDFIEEKDLSYMGRASQFALAATKLGVEDGRLNLGRDKRVGVIVGTTLADAQSLEQIDKYWLKGGMEEVWDSNILKYPGYNLSDNISQYFGLKGGNFVIPTACAAGNYSIGFAYDLIKENRFDVIIAGGADPIARTNFAGFNRLVAMAPEKCQPFDLNRKGMMVGEGAGILIIEGLEHAKKRGAEIYSEILGYGLSCDAYNMTIPSQNGITQVMKRAIKNSGVDQTTVGYICAHGTGTPANDKTECAAIKELFGDQAKDVSVSSIKSILGHTMGAASAIEAISCCLTIKEQIMPPTINMETQDPECNLDCVPNKSRKKKIKVVMNNSFAFGGNNASLILSKYYG